MQHLGDRGGGGADVSQSQVAEEDVHGGLEAWSRDNQCDDGQVARDVDGIHE